MAEKLGKVNICCFFIIIPLFEISLFRDDRCVSDHGREVWFPYLDEELVALIQSLPMSVVSSVECSIVDLLIIFMIGGGSVVTSRCWR